MGAATYTYLVADLRTGAVLDELPLTGVSFDKRLNDTGTLRGQLKVDDPEMRVREPRLLTEPGRTAIYVDRDGDLLWGGIIWTSRYQAASGTLEIGAADFLSYFEHRRVLMHPVVATDVVSYTDTDQLEIAAALIALVQSHPGGDLDIAVSGTQTSGVHRTVSYAAGELKPVADALRDLANADGGFDFAADVEYGPGGQPTRFIRFGYPRLGQPGAPHVWEYGANIVDFSWPIDAARMATRMFAQGTTDSDQPLLQYAEDAAAYPNGWTLLDDAASQLDTRDPALVEAQARGELAARRRPVVLPELTVRADLDPIVGTYSVGDDVRVVLPDAFFASDEVDVTLRLLGFEVTPGDDAGLEQVTLTVAPIPEPL
ncbi:MAG TPA: hypothetical protein VHJ83_02400 [Micromonosporaceae bacterium]|nr:hypothetical protein [Micromonosporaceae bacterium]